MFQCLNAHLRNTRERLREIRVQLKQHIRKERRPSSYSVAWDRLLWHIPTWSDGKNHSMLLPSYRVRCRYQVLYVFCAIYTSDCWYISGSWLCWVELSVKPRLDTLVDLTVFTKQFWFTKFYSLVKSFPDKPPSGWPCFLGHTYASFTLHLFHIIFSPCSWLGAKGGIPDYVHPSALHTVRKL